MKGKPKGTGHKESGKLRGEGAPGAKKTAAKKGDKINTGKGKKAF